MILLIDNFDSFVFNLARHFIRLGQTTQVVRQDQLSVALIRQMQPQAIVISPGPCAPQQAGCCVEVVEQLAAEVPMLGVCLGHQVIGQALGGRIVRAPTPVHGMAAEVFHQGDDLLAGLPSPFVAGRYHSLIVEEATLPDCLKVTARTADGIIMAVSHRQYPLFGVQFHPESILTDVGYPLLARFLQMAGLPVKEVPSISDEFPGRPGPLPPLPNSPVTF